MSLGTPENSAIQKLSIIIIIIMPQTCRLAAVGPSPCHRLVDCGRKGKLSPTEEKVGQDHSKGDAHVRGTGRSVVGSQSDVIAPEFGTSVECA